MERERLLRLRGGKLKRGGGPFFSDPMDFYTTIFPTATVEDLETLLKSGEWKSDMIRAAILVKQNGYDKLTDMELLAEVESAHKYRKYLQRSETDFDWRGEEVPQGLLDAVSENDDICDALDFEIERRKQTENKKKETDTI